MRTDGPDWVGSNPRSVSGHQSVGSLERMKPGEYNNKLARIRSLTHRRSVRFHLDSVKISFTIFATVSGSTHVDARLETGQQQCTPE